MRQNLANDEQFNQHLAKYYQQAIDNINSELEHELLNMKKGHFLNQEVVEATDVQHYQEKAKKIVEEAQKIRQAGNKVTYADFSKSVNDQLKVYNSTMRVSRLEMLKSQIGLEMVQSGIDVDKALHDKLSQDYIDEVKRQAGILGVTAKPSMWTDSKVAKVIMGQTESANFSQRLWANQAALKAQLDQVISNGIIQGQNPREMATKLKANVAKTIANYRYVTERLVRTESARVQYRAQMDSLIANDYRFCKWHAEPGHCKVCGEIASNDPDGNGRGIYEVDDVPIVPVHPNCRCSISAYWVNGQDNSLKGKHKKSKITAKKSDGPIGVDDMSESLKKTIYDYTDGKFQNICGYSQYITDKSHIAPNFDVAKVTENEKKAVSAIHTAIKSHPIENNKLVRVERTSQDFSAGQKLSFGIRSATRDKNFINEMAQNSIDGFTPWQNDVTYTEYVFDTSRSLDISKISAYKAQQEELVQGTYKVVSVEQKAGSNGGVEWKTYGIKDYAEQNNLKPTIKTSKSGKKHYIFNIAGKDKDFPESQYEKNRTFSIEVKTKFEAPRRVVHLKYDD